MSTTLTSSANLVADAIDLKAKLRRAERLKKFEAFMLVSPLLLFILVSFLFPILQLLWKSVANPEVVTVLPQTTQAIRVWDGHALPPETVFVALANDMRIARENSTLASAGKRLNYEISGFQSLINQTGRKVAAFQTGNYRQQFIDADERWGEITYWQAIARTAKPYTDLYLLSATDHARAPDGSIVKAAAEEAIHAEIFLRTFWISLLVTVACLVLAYPLAYLLANLPAKTANLLMILVLLPFWTSLLVRTTAWIVLLQQHGVVNEFLLWLGVIDKPLQLIFNRTGVVIAMTHILLPFMVLPLYSVMKGILPVYNRASAMLGANMWTTFWRVYFPQTLPGIGAGGLLVFIMALGYYITPALVGGAQDQMASYFIAQHVNLTLNWGMAAALATLLLLATLVLYAVYDRMVGINNMKLG